MYTAQVKCMLGSEVDAIHGSRLMQEGWGLCEVLIVVVQYFFVNMLGRKKSS